MPLETSLRRHHHLLLRAAVLRTYGDGLRSFVLTTKTNFFFTGTSPHFTNSAPLLLIISSPSSPHPLLFSTFSFPPQTKCILFSSSPHSPPRHSLALQKNILPSSSFFFYSLPTPPPSPPERILKASSPTHGEEKWERRSVRHRLLLLLILLSSSHLHLLPPPSLDERNRATTTRGS